MTAGPSHPFEPSMTSHQFPSSLRDEIAAIAARLIAEEGMDYAGAKRRALRELSAQSRGAIGADCMPDNATVEAAVREHQALFMADEQPVRLHAMRLTAIDAMRHLAPFSPWLTGAVLNGTAGEHSDIHLQVVNDNGKDIEIFLLNAGVDFDVSEGRDDTTEVLSFLWPPRTPFAHRQDPAVGTETIHLAVVDPRAHRSLKAGRAVDRAQLAGVEALVVDTIAGGAPLGDVEGRR